MKVLENVTLYVCEYCKKRLILKHAMEKHEFNCSANPKNTTICSMCCFLEVGETTVQSDYYGEMQKQKQKTFHCKKLNKNMYPFKVVKKRLLERFPESFAGKEQMPQDCSDARLHA